ncbi:MAG: mechanosensitive ion channel family protein [Acidobacteriota bacterium]
MLLSVFQGNQLQESWMQVSQAYTNFFVRLINFLPEITGSLVVILFTALCARVMRRTVSSAMARTKADQGLQVLIVRGSGVMVWFVGITIVLSVLNINLAGTLASLGLAGAAIGFAIQDIIANFVAGIVLLSIRPFKLGDTITIEAHEGTVERIEVRVTVLKTFDGREISIPNAKVFSAVIINHSVYGARRITFTLGISHESSLEQAQEVIRQAIRAIPGVASTPTPEVSITNFSANAVNLEIQCWVDKGAVFGTVSSKVKMGIKEALQREQIAIAPASSTILLRPEPPRNRVNRS